MRGIEQCSTAYLRLGLSPAYAAPHDAAGSGSPAQSETADAQFEALMALDASQVHDQLRRLSAPDLMRLLMEVHGFIDSFDPEERMHLIGLERLSARLNAYPWNLSVPDQLQLSRRFMLDAVLDHARALEALVHAAADAASGADDPAQVTAAEQLLQFRIEQRNVADRYHALWCCHAEAQLHQEEEAPRQYAARAALDAAEDAFQGQVQVAQQRALIRTLHTVAGIDPDRLGLEAAYPSHDTHGTQASLAPSLRLNPRGVAHALDWIEVAQACSELVQGYGKTPAEIAESGPGEVAPFRADVAPRPVGIAATENAFGPVAVLRLLSHLRAPFIGFAGAVLRLHRHADRHPASPFNRFATLNEVGRIAVPLYIAAIDKAAGLHDRIPEMSAHEAVMAADERAILHGFEALLREGYELSVLEADSLSAEERQIRDALVAGLTSWSMHLANWTQSATVLNIFFTNVACYPGVPHDALWPGVPHNAFERATASVFYRLSPLLVPIPERR